MYQRPVNALIEKIKLEKGARLEFMVVEDDEANRNFLYLVMIERVYADFKAKFESGEKFNPEDYGTILIQGEGETPPPEVLVFLKECFGDKLID